MEKFNLGDEVKCTITGFQGIIVAKTKWINGCHTSGVRSQTLKDGLPSEVQWFDDPQLTTIKESVISVGVDPGGPTKKPKTTMVPQKL